MPYIGPSQIISFTRGGLTGDPNIGLLEPQQMIIGLNINLHENGRVVRGGTTKVNSTAISAVPQIMSVYQFIKRNLNTFILATTASGRIVKDYITDLKTGLAPNVYSHFETFNDKVYISNGSNRPQVWDGVAATTSDLGLLPTDWGSNNFPKQIIKHGRGASERLWAIGCPNKPHSVYISKVFTDDFSDAQVKVINIETGEGYGIVGAIEFGDRLLCFGKNKVYMIEDTDTNINNWGYEAATWDGGAAHWRLIGKTANDLVAMAEDGNIYSVQTAQEYGDYKMASITRPAFIDRWMREKVQINAIDKFHFVYDMFLRALKVFVVMGGNQLVDTCLTYFVDRGPIEGWVVHDNSVYPSGFDASCSARVYVDKKFKIYTGDYSGSVWSLEEKSKSDAGNRYWSGFKTPPIAAENLRVSKKYSSGTVVGLCEGVNTKINIWIDNVAQVQQNLSFPNIGARYGTGKYNTDGDVYGNIDMNEPRFDILQIGKNIQFEIFNNAANEEFFISHLIYDYQVLGPRKGDKVAEGS